MLLDFMKDFYEGLILGGSSSVVKVEELKYLKGT